MNRRFLNRGLLRRRVAFGVILLLALLAFEIFNYSITHYALVDLIGANLKFLGLSWATILSLAFCGIDFAGIARLFTPEQGRDKSKEVWYLGAWLIAATANAILTWRGVSVAIRNHANLLGETADRSAVIIPVFVAFMVWLIRVLIIGTFSMAGDRLFSMAEARSKPPVRRYPPEIPSNPYKYAVEYPPRINPPNKP